MLQMLRKRLHKTDDEGFTLIELMVVVLIIAILLAIAIPTFLGARSRAQNRAAQSNLRNALTTEKTIYTDAQAYTATVATLTAAEPSLTWVTTAPASGNNVEVQAVANEVCLTAVSASGVTYYMVDVATAGTSTVAGTWFGASDLTTPSTAPTCDGNTALAGFFNNSTAGFA